MSTDPVLPHAGDPRYFGRYHYAASNPYRYTDPTGENIVSGFFESVAQGWDALTGGSFDGGAVKDALVDGYDGERGALGFAGALAEDVATVAVGWVINGAIRGAGVAARAVNAGRNVDRVSDVTKKGLGGNPFKDKTPEQIDKALRDKGFEAKGPDPAAGKGSYINPKTGRKYYLDKGGKYKKGTELPHVDVHRPSGSSLPKKKLPLGDRLIE